MPHSPEQIRTQLGKMLTSGTFAQAERLRRFLGFIVEHSLTSPDVPLKEIIVGIELYAAGGDFDPRVTAVVRVDATRLRAKLRDYYGSEGATDPLIIDLPKGRYTPAFLEAKAETRERTREHAAEPSIAVFPFSNLSPEPEDYFSDGLTEEIIHALSSVPGIRVVARTSAFALKDRSVDIRQAGQALNVDFVLEGSVRKSNDALRVTVQLIDTKDGFQLWSRRYERHVGDVFAVQDEIAGEIVDMLCVSTGKKPRALSANTAGTFEAYSLYLQGRYHLNRQTRESLYRAIVCFERALAISPRHAPAFRGAQHITLQHKFESTDPARPGTFTTEDRAVCAPAGKDPAVCRVNDVLTIVSGTGIFANAEGSLRNHGIIDLSTFSLSFSIRGRVCGDGVQERKQPSIPM